MSHVVFVSDETANVASLSLTSITIRSGRKRMTLTVSTYGRLALMLPAAASLLSVKRLSPFWMPDADAISAAE